MALDNGLAALQALGYSIYQRLMPLVHYHLGSGTDECDHIVIAELKASGRQ